MPNNYHVLETLYNDKTPYPDQVAVSKNSKKLNVKQ
mgnify:CR=1 FL=1